MTRGKKKKRRKRRGRGWVGVVVREAKTERHVV